MATSRIYRQPDAVFKIGTTSSICYLSDADDLNDVIDLGFYSWSANSSPLNSPVPGKGGRMIVFGNDTTNASCKVQIIVYIGSSGGVYVRTGTSSGWASFIRMTTNFLIEEAPESGTLKSTDDLNNIVELGMYSWGSSISPINNPAPGTSGRLIVLGNITSNRVHKVQIVITHLGDVYLRSGLSSAWGPFRYFPKDTASRLEALETICQPRITEPLEDVVYSAGQVMKLVARANNAAPNGSGNSASTGYDWEYKTSSDGDEDPWRTPSSGSTSAVYTLTVASRHNGYRYRCKVSNALGSVYTNVITLTVQ